MSMQRDQWIASAAGRVWDHRGEGRTGLAELVKLLQGPPVGRVTNLARAAMAALIAQLQELTSQTKVMEREIPVALLRARS